MPLFDKYKMVIDKEEIENLKYSKIEDYMSEFDFNDGLIYENKNQLEIVIYGYDDDSRELYQIEEVTNWVKTSITEEHIPWYLLLRTNPESQSIKLLTLCYCADPKNEYRLNGEKLKEFGFLNFGILNNYFKEKNLLDGQNYEIATNINNYFRSWFGDYQDYGN